ncbi:hypothetical protein ACHAWF_010793 [Thalassiosira exigua]
MPTPTAMAPLMPSSDHESRRAAALEEAASVLRALSSGRGGGGGGDPADRTAGKGADGGDAPSNAPAAAPPPPPPAPPRSRDEAVAAARRRAEERRRAGRPPPSSSVAPSGAAEATAGAAGAGSAAAGSGAPRPSAASASSARPPSSSIPPPDPDSMDWFNLLGVVTGPASGSGLDPYNIYASGRGSASSPSHSSHSHHYSYHRSRHGGLSSHGTPISLDHVGSDGGSSGLSGGDEGYASALLRAAGVSAESTAAADAALASVAGGLDDLAGWFDRYSRRYLGTVAGIDAPPVGGMAALGEDGIGPDGTEGGLLAGGLLGAAGVGEGGRALSGSLAEYEPEMGEDELPSSQLEEMPRELAELDLGSVEGHLGECGMLGMRFEDRGGGFKASRERSELRKKRKDEEMGAGEDGREEKSDGDDEAAIDATNANNNNNNVIKKDDMAATEREDTKAAAAASTLDAVPEIFFSPYFDLTDPVNFEGLLLIGDEEVARIREKEAELHALADRKVKDAEDAAARDAGSENVAPRPPPKRGGKAREDEAAAAAEADSAGTSLSGDARTTSTPADDNVITLRRPEAFAENLDSVELVLLDQVRSRSERFFRETNRFSELRGLVAASVDEVRGLRSDLDAIRERCVTNVEVVPTMDDGRRELRRIRGALDAAEDVVRCKASVAGRMAAGDHPGAVEAIRTARALLAGGPPGDDDDDENDGDGDCGGDGGDPASSRPRRRHRRLPLGKLRALSKVGEQLDEYEKLAVRNLTDELVETFLSWGTEGGMADADQRPRATLTTAERDKIRGAVKSLRACGRLGGVGAAYQERLCDLISVTVKAIVTECVADATKNPSGAGSGAATAADGGGGAGKGTMAGVASMTLDQFFDCINMLFEQVLGLLRGAFAVNKFCIEEGFILGDKSRNGPSSLVASEDAGGAGGGSHPPQHAPSATAAALAAAADLSEKSASELLRLRREAHSLVTFEGMRRLWDTSLAFAHRLERLSGRKAYGLRSALLAQAKGFVERRHEANVTALVAALDGERWVQCNVSVERQAALDRLCSGRAAFSSRKTTGVEPVNSPGPPPGGSGRDKMTDAVVEGVRYKVVWSCLLLLEMVMDDVACAAHFQTLATNVVGKVAELLRLFNTRSTHLVLGAGAIHGAARLKSINAKHLAIVTQCIALLLTVLPHVRAALMAQLPARQHSLLHDLDKIKADLKEHSEKILGKLVSIIGGIVEHSLAPRIANTDFDTRAKSATPPSSDNPIECCQFLDNVITNTNKMHQVLLVMLPAELLRDVFSRIFAYLDHKVPSLFKTASTTPERRFSMPTTDEGKLQMIVEVEYMAETLNGLAGVQPWNFTATKILEQELEITRNPSLNEQEDSAKNDLAEQANIEDGPPEDASTEISASTEDEKLEDLSQTATVENHVTDLSDNKVEATCDDTSGDNALSGKSKVSE